MKKFAFTLAEVLITLTIIGVIAAMTIPSLIRNTHQQEYIVAFKKSVASINQAITLHYAIENADVAKVITRNSATSTALIDNIFANRMNLKSKSGTTFSTTDVITYTVSNVKNCVATRTYSSLTARTHLSDACAKLTVDVNGTKLPNIQTVSTNTELVKDRFFIYLFPDKVVLDPALEEHIMYDN